MRVDIWSDISCPWCYITKRTFELGLAAAGRHDLDIVLHPYQIDGERPAEPMPMLDWLAGKYGRETAETMSKEVTEAGNRHGIAFRNRTGLAANTLQAHRMLWYAGREYGRSVQSRLEELLFAAYFTQNGDVSDPALLLDRAVRSGFGRARAADLLASDEGLAEVRQEIRAARSAGVAQVPLIVFGGARRVEGAQEDPEVYRSALARTSDTAGTTRKDQE
ncbi:DsbA family protein [Streptomyces sp. NPDC057552]|uniref:DsbA family oxidoreductase n=1 Tax=Streptomyces sp. NPDC057552 TaxID=3350537 RepID=UPI00369C5D2D